MGALSCRDESFADFFFFCWVCWEDVLRYEMQIVYCAVRFYGGLMQIYQVNG